MIVRAWMAGLLAGLCAGAACANSGPVGPNGPSGSSSGGASSGGGGSGSGSSGSSGAASSGGSSGTSSSSGSNGSTTDGGSDVGQLSGTAYYVNSTSGSDSNAGTSPQSAWKTLAKANATTFSPGDAILLAAGGMWTGSLNPQGSGNATAPIRIDMYGTGAKPIVDGAGVAGNGVVYFNNQQYWEINNLEITNDAPSAGDRRGIYLSAANSGVISHLYVRNCNIHNIKGMIGQDLASKRTGAVVIEVTDDTTMPTRFDDVRIEGNTIAHIDNTGIVTSNQSGTGYPGTASWNNRVFTRFVVRNNSFNDIAKNAMIVRLADESGLIEHNVAWDTAFRATTGNTFFATVSRGTIFQFNEGYLNRETGGFDGSLYDSDLSSPQCVWQYSYSHDNAWGLFVMDTTAQDDGVIVRYNISQNDKGSIFTLTYPNTGVLIYNNTIYIPSSLSPYIINDRRVNTKTYSFYNNIFYNLSTGASYNFLGGATRTFGKNLFFGQHPSSEPSGPSNLTADPLLVGPGTGGTGIMSVGGYKLQSGSPAIGAGIPVMNNGGRDYFGNPVPAPPSAPSIGAHQP